MNLGKSWTFNTTLEAAYPVLLAQRASACMVQWALGRHWTLHPVPTLHDVSSASHGRQTKRHRPLVPEYHHVSFVAPNTPVPEGAKILPPHIGGLESEEDGQDEEAAQDVEEKQTEQKTAGGVHRVKLGFWHTPKQFLSMAKRAVHPMDSTDHLEDVAREALAFNLRSPACGSRKNEESSSG